MKPVPLQFLSCWLDSSPTFELVSQTPGGFPVSRNLHGSILAGFMLVARKTRRTCPA